MEKPKVALWRDLTDYVTDPLKFVHYIYPWESEELPSHGPRTWQATILREIRKHLENPATHYQPCRIAVSSGHGIGKSALIAMVTHWALDTCDNSRAQITAGTGNQLGTKTIPEANKWFRLGRDADEWEMHATSIRAKSLERHATWRADFVTWSADEPYRISGLHNEGKRILLVFDEASVIHDKVWEAVYGAQTDENTEIIWLAFGNPVKHSGAFSECFGSKSHRWKTFQIDSRTVEGTNKEEIGQWLEDYGEDSDWFRVKVRGEFPRRGFNEFIPADVVAQCRKFRAQGFASTRNISA